MRTTRGSERCSSTHSAVTSADSRLMGLPPVVGDALMDGDVWWSRPPRCQAAGEQVQLAAQAEARGCVEESGGEREPDGDGCDHGDLCERGGEAGEREDPADGLGEARRT